MTAIAAITLSSGHRGEHRWHYGQVRTAVYHCNGHDPNRIFDTRRGISYAAGIDAPGAGATATPGAAGLVTGLVTYRIRWRDENTNTMSLPSAIVSPSVTPASQQVTISVAALVPPARATHYIVERILAGETIYFPVNRTASAPHGTSVTVTSFVDNVSDDTLGARKSINERQGKPGPYRVAFANLTRIFLVGREVHQATCLLTNGSKNVYSADASFVADQAGQYFGKTGDVTSGKTYRIETFTDASNIILFEVYAGATETVLCNIAAPGDREAWSEAGEPEHFGEAEVGFLANEQQVGGQGDTLIGGVGLGPPGALLAGASSLYFHSYKINPRTRPYGDGEVIQLPTRRGIVGPMALRYIDGLVYGMDYAGIWRMQPGSSPEEIGGDLANDWKRTALNFMKGDNWHIGWDPTKRWLYFFVCENTDTYPKKAYIFDIARNAYLGTRTFALGVSCTTELPDSQGAVRMCYVTEISGTVKSYLWMSGVGDYEGADASQGGPLSGTATAGGAATLTCAGAAWPTTNEKLKGVAITLFRTADNSEESRIITDNTATVATISTNWTGALPVNGDTFKIGGIDSIYRSGRINAGEPKLKKRFKRLFIWVKHLGAGVTFKVRQYLDGKATAYSDRAARNEDGILITAGSADVQVDPTYLASDGSQRNVFEIPLNNEWAKDSTIEVRSRDGGQPWHIMAMQLEGEVEDNITPAEV